MPQRLPLLIFQVIAVCIGLYWGLHFYPAFFAEGVSVNVWPYLPLALLVLYTAATQRREAR